MYNLATVSMQFHARDAGGRSNGRDVTRRMISCDEAGLDGDPDGAKETQSQGDTKVPEIQGGADGLMDRG